MKALEHTEDRRVHERLESLEVSFKMLRDQHLIISKQIEENTKMTKSVMENTASIIEIVKGANGIRRLIVWLLPVAGVVGAAWAGIKIWAAWVRNS